MSDRINNLGSATGVAVAVAGAASHDWMTTLAGPLIALIFHVLQLWKSGKRDALLDHCKMRNYQLELEVAKLRGTVPTPPQAIP
jgi:hypothetical protein